MILSAFFFFSAWIADDEDPAIARVSARTSALTGLSLETVELFQVLAEIFFWVQSKI